MKEHAEDVDPKILRAMVRTVSLFPVGSHVRRNNGGLARVVSINPDNFYRPQVEVVLDPSGQRVRGGRVIDLADSPFLHIVGPVPEEAALAETTGPERGRI